LSRVVKKFSSNLKKIRKDETGWLYNEIRMCSGILLMEMRKVKMIAGSIIRRTRHSVSLVLILFSAFFNLFSENMTGVYGPLTLAHNEKSARLTGYFESRTGWDSRTRSPRYSCLFILIGEKCGTGYRISLGYPGKPLSIGGELQFEVLDGIPKAHLKLDDIPGGCGNAFPFDLARGNVFERDVRGEWIEIAVVSSQRAYFHTEPDAEMKREDYVVVDDILRIIQKENGWVFAEYVGETITRGWIRESDLVTL
jgi:hypothetical protein